ncbi:MAG TPA: hypothetical protein VMZ03_00600 [Chitinophagaceae bacterium]|nr:hypothetical protein [Chitinophagaceae bacterium]
MKNLRTAVLCAGIALCSLGSYAQGTVPVNEPDYNKPKLFSQLPDKIQVNTADLASLFNTSVGKATNLAFADDTHLQFEGEVISSGNQNTLQSMVIRSTNFNGARFTLSRITNPDGSVTYRGRIISFKHGDLLELQNQNGQYVLVKKNFYDLVNE